MHEKNGEHPFGDVGQFVFLGIFLVVWAGDSFFLHFSTSLAKYIPLYVRLPILGVMLLVAIYLSNAVHNLIYHGQRPEGVITTGVFRYIRHPMYLASHMTCLGLAISTASLLSFAAWVVVFAFYNYIASYEEKLLEAKYGEEYREYRDRTGKWIPKLNRI